MAHILICSNTIVQPLHNRDLPHPRMLDSGLFQVGVRVHTLNPSSHPPGTPVFVLAAPVIDTHMVMSHSQKSELLFNREALDFLVEVGCRRENLSDFDHGAVGWSRGARWVDCSVAVAQARCEESTEVFFFPALSDKVGNMLLVCTYLDRHPCLTGQMRPSLNLISTLPVSSVYTLFVLCTILGK